MRFSTKTANRILVVTVALYLIFVRLASLYLYDRNPMFNDIIATLLLIVPSLAWIAKKDHYWKDYVGFGEISNDNIRMSIAVIAAFYPCVVCLNILSMYFVKNVVSGLIPFFMQIGLINSLLIFAVLPAFCEEFLCRGIIYGSYRGVHRFWGVIVSALIFGLLHMNLNQMPYAFLLGVIFAMMFEATGNIFSTMLMHFALNGFNIGLNFLVIMEDPEAAAAGEAAQSAIDYSVLDMKSLVTLVAVFLLFFIVTLLLVDKTFKQNGKNMKQVLFEKILPEEHGEMSTKESIFSLWLLVFIIVMIFLTVRWTSFN